MNKNEITCRYCQETVPAEYRRVMADDVVAMVPAHGDCYFYTEWM